MPSVARPQSWPQLGASPRSVTEALGFPTLATSLQGRPLRQYVLANRTLWVLYADLRVVALACRYRGTPPAWSVQAAELQRCLPAADSGTDNAPAQPVVLPTAAGWVVATAQLPVATLRALVAVGD